VVAVASVVRHLVHPLRFWTARRLWAYAGLGVDDGRAQRPLRGRVPRHNESLRRAVLSLPGAWARHGGPWLALHEALLPAYVELHAARCGCGQEGHARRMAWREVARRWLLDGWLRWREIAVRDAEEALRRQSWTSPRAASLGGTGGCSFRS